MQTNNFLGLDSCKQPSMPAHSPKVRINGKSSIFYCAFVGGKHQQRRKAEQIRDIAFQCPLSGGKGVFKARALYTFIYGDTTYNDSAVCAAQGLVWRKGNPQNTTVKTIPSFSMIAYPNPANDEVTFEFSEEMKISGQFIIYNSIGKKVVTYILPEGIKKYTLSVRNFAQGGYYAQLQVGGIQTATKLIIQH